MSPSDPVVDVRGLSVCYGATAALRGVHLAVSRGEIVAVVGESGAGKTTLARAIGGLLPGGDGPIEAGQVVFQHRDLLADPQHAARVCGDRITLALQDTGLDPLMTVREHLSEPFRARRHRRRPSDEQLAPMCEVVGLDPALFDRRPHELSGGQARQVSVTVAFALDPDVVVLDEPSAGLDVLTTRQLMGSLTRSIRRRGIAAMIITHDLRAVAAQAYRIVVLYAGRVVEDGAATRVLAEPRHPYTHALLAAAPSLTSGRDLHPIRGLPPDPTDLPTGCAYGPRCAQAVAACATTPPELDDGEHRAACHLGGVITRLRASEVVASRGSGRTRRVVLRAPAISIRAGEAVGVIGATGSGKSTLADVLGGVLRPDTGTVTIHDPRHLGERPWLLSHGHDERPHPDLRRTAPRAEDRRTVQHVGQDPAAVFAPRWTIERSLREVFELNPSGAPDAAVAAATIRRVLDLVGIPTTERILRARPAQVSGGQLQRLALARALLAEPAVLVADEPTALLDPSEQARLAVILRDEQIERGLSLLLVSHDLALVRRITDRVYVLHDGRVVEDGPTDEVFAHPSHPQTRALVASSGHADPRTPTRRGTRHDPSGFSHLPCTQP